MLHFFFWVDVYKSNTVRVEEWESIINYYYQEKNNWIYWYKLPIVSLRCTQHGHIIPTHSRVLREVTWICKIPEKFLHYQFDARNLSSQKTTFDITRLSLTAILAADDAVHIDAWNIQLWWLFILWANSEYSSHIAIERFRMQDKILCECQEIESHSRESSIVIHATCS